MNLLEPATIDWPENNPAPAFSVPARRPVTRRPWFPWFVVFLILVILVCAFSPLVIVRSGHRGLATFFGDSQGDVYAPGLHVKYPLLRIHQFDIRTQTEDVSTGAVTADMQLVTLGVTVSYHLDEDKLKGLFADVGQDIDTKTVTPAVKEALNAAATQFTAADLVSKRTAVKAAVLAEAQARLNDRGVIVEDVAITDVSFSKTLQQAFEARAVAEQAAETATLDAQTAATKSQTDNTLSAAEAERIHILGDALHGNEAYIQYEIMQKWDGKSPLYLAPTAPVQIVGTTN